MLSSRKVGRSTLRIVDRMLGDQCIFSEIEALGS